MAGCAAERSAIFRWLEPKVDHYFSPPRGLAQFVRNFANRPLVHQVGWVVGPFGAQQVIRLATQIVLARLLAPEFFGLMVVVNTLRTGAELLSDIGIGQSVVRSPHGDDRRFLDVAWTLQALRGTVLSLLMMVAAVPVAGLYQQPGLLQILLAVAPIFFISGLLSPALFTLQRKVDLRRRAIYEMTCIVFQCAFTIALAWIMPSVWALVWGLLVSTTVSTALSFLVDRYRPRIAWDPKFGHEILHFGKWIFLSTAIYFASTSFDRMYFVGVLPLALAGIFGIARTFSDMLASLAQRACGLLVFPKVAGLQGRREEMAPRVRRLRRKALALAALGTGMAVAVSDRFILFAYDPRYHAAAFIIPLLMLGVWFSILSSFAESMLMGDSRPAPGAWSNAAKFAVMLVGLPMALAKGDMLAALFVLVAAEVARWVALLPSSIGAGFVRLRDDLALTAATVGTAVGTKVVLGAAGLVPTVSGWWAMRVLLHG